MFGVGIPEMAVIAFVAVFVFGPERLPELARQAGQMVRKGRQFAHSARDELRSELGPEYADLQLRDLDPRTIVRKHIMEAMEDEPTPGQSSAQSTQSATLTPGETPPFDPEST